MNKICLEVNVQWEMEVSAMEEKCGGWKSLGHGVEPEEVMLQLSVEFNEAKGREPMESLMERSVFHKLT